VATAVVGLDGELLGQERGQRRLLGVVSQDAAQADHGRPLSAAAVEGHGRAVLVM
jgi:hypothetical protein